MWKKDSISTGSVIPISLTSTLEETGPANRSYVPTLTISTGLDRSGGIALEIPLLVELAFVIAFPTASQSAELAALARALRNREKFLM
jgi:hypothetical protein